MPFNGVIKFDTDGTSLFPFSPEEIVKEKLLFLLRTRKGEIANDPTYGTNLHTLQFSHNDIALQLAAEKEVRQAIADRMPFVVIRSVKAHTEDDKGLLQYKIEYALSNGFTDQIEFGL